MGAAAPPVVVDVLDAIRTGWDPPPDENRFEELAARVYEHQMAHNAVYRSYVERRGVTPSTWKEVPPVPTEAFKHVPLCSGDPERASRLFETSGTSGTRRGTRYVLHEELYRASLLASFERHLLHDGARPALVSLIPDPEDAPRSSLSYMIGAVADHFGLATTWAMHPRDGLLQDALVDALRDAEEPLLVVGTAFAFVHWLDACEALGLAFELPAGSRVMETGGFKGRSRAVPREHLYAELRDRLGVPPERVVNEYGMTELFSQYYEPVLRSRPVPALHERHHEPPPWMRFQVLDPASLEPLPAGERGLVHHFDLANVGAVASILTEDTGVRSERGLTSIARFEGAEPRGCSLAVDQLLARA